jgi:hypothetical protein
MSDRNERVGWAKRSAAHHDGLRLRLSPSYKPLLHFFLLGALLFAGKQLTADWRALGMGRETIRVPAAQVERLRTAWTAQAHRAPTADELDALVRAWADEEILVREALRRGIERTDPVVRSRLVQNMRFVHDAAQDERALFEEALALGLAPRDTVVRRRLVQALQEQLVGTARPSDDEVHAFVQRHPGRYAAPARVAFRQVFVDADRHRTDLASAAQVLGARLATGTPARGDPFLLGEVFPAFSEAEIAHSFGGDFASAVMRAPAGAWTGPIRSPYGLHYVFIERHLDAQPADYASVRRQAYYALLQQREQEAVRAALRGLRRLYPVAVASPTS